MYSSSGSLNGTVSSLGSVASLSSSINDAFDAYTNARLLPGGGGGMNIIMSLGSLTEISYSSSKNNSKISKTRRRSSLTDSGGKTQKKSRNTHCIMNSTLMNSKFNSNGNGNGHSNNPSSNNVNVNVTRNSQSYTSKIAVEIVI